MMKCKFCQYYRFEGHRGGHCSTLGATVQGDWKACCLGESTLLIVKPSQPTEEFAVTKSAEVSHNN